MLPLKEFLTFLGRQKDMVKIEANVNIGELAEYADRRKRTDAIVSLMWPYTYKRMNQQRDYSFAT